MDIKVIDVEEKKGLLRVKVKHDYGEDNLGLSLHQKYLGDDGQPKWKAEVKKLMEAKYGNRNTDKSLPVKKVFQEEVGKIIKIDEKNISK